MRKVLSEVLPAIKPSPQEMSEELAFARTLLEHIRGNIPAGCEAMLTGSVAKRTFLRDKRDVDIFVLFGLNTPREGLEPAIRGIMEAAFPKLGYQLSYAEHPYARFRFEGRRIDLVPAYKITDASQRLSAVDRSSLHTHFVLGSLKKGQSDDVLLLKQFLRANSLYGAEIKVEGFSGYLCELLIIYYGSFRALARAAAKWKAPIFIDVKKHYPDRKSVRDASVRFGQFVVIDPTDKNRNVAAAVSPGSLKSFISLCRSFIKKPSKGFFLRRPELFEEKLMKAARTNVVFLASMPRPEVVDDVLWGQLRKISGQLRARLEDFKPVEIAGDDGRHLVRLGIVLGTDTIPPTMWLEGPPLKMAGHVAKFKKAHRGSKFIKKKGKISAEVRRSAVSARAAIKQFFRELSKSRSHLAYPEEIIILERVEGKAGQNKTVKKSIEKKPKAKAAKGKTAKRKRS